MKAAAHHVEEGVQLLVLHDLADLLPLLRGGVHARWVVGTGVQQYHIARVGALKRRRVVQVTQHRVVHDSGGRC